MDLYFFNSIAAFFVCAGIVLALVLAFFVSQHKPHMKIMGPVWILTGLWASFLGVWAYFKLDRSRSKMEPSSMGNMKSGNMSMKMPMKSPRWQSVALSTLHCGAGCTLADLVGEWFTFYVPVSIGGSMLAGSWVIDYILALFFGFFFQYFAIREMEKVSPATALKRAVKADFLSLTAWQIGMYGWMAISMFVIFKDTTFTRDSWMFWFLMQIAMFFGFCVAYPVNALLIKAGIKNEM